jgi:hypothetical protein
MQEQPTDTSLHRQGGARAHFSPARLWFLTALLLLATGSCLGDIEIERAQVRPADAGVGTVNTDSLPLDPECVVDQVRCNATWLERCNARATGATRWEKIEDCHTPALCQADPGRCNAPACDFNAVRCDGGAPQRCSVDRTGWEAVGAECVNAAHCSPDSAKCAAEGAEAPCCLAVPCEPGELRCNTEEIQRCRADQTDLDSVATCKTPALCDASLEQCRASSGACVCVPPACDAGATRCTEATLERCNADQTAWEFVEACGTPALCQAGRSLLPLACKPIACAVGQHACSTTGELQLCNGEQSGFDPVKACPGGAAFCNQEQGVCTDTPCGPGDRACRLAQLMICRDDQTDFDIFPEQCATAELCNDDGEGHASCSAPACPDGEVICNVNQLMRCNPGRTAFVNILSPCLRADLCSAERQRCDSCVPNRRECTPDQTASRTCRPDGNTFGSSTFCPLGCIPESGLCRTCPVGQYTCNQGQLSRCNDGFSTTPLNRRSDCMGTAQISCSGNTPQSISCGAPSCNIASGACNECAGAARRCASASSFQTCNGGTFGSAAPCADGLSCQGNGECLCIAGDNTCSNTGQPLVCVAGQRIPAPACDPGLACVGAGLCRCTPGALHCAGEAVLACDPDGTGFVAADTCTSEGLQLGCVLGEPAPSACPLEQVCVPGVGCQAATPEPGE